MNKTIYRKIRVLVSLTLIWSLFCSVALQASAGPGGVSKLEHSRTFEFERTLVYPIADKINNRQYEIAITLPESYQQKPEKSYPVIYYSDLDWHIEIISASARFLLEDAILVGVSWQKDLEPALVEEVSPYLSRFRDYSVVPSKDPDVQQKYQLGQAKKHLDFIRKSVVPLVEEHYRTQPDNRAYFGYSLGGLFGAYILLNQPGTFQHYLLGSPSV